MKTNTEHSRKNRLKRLFHNRKRALAFTASGIAVASTVSVVAPQVYAASNNSQVIQLTLWHAMSGSAADALNQLITNFNNSQNKIHVTAVYQGQYDDEFNKWKATQGSGSGPNIMQVYDIGTRYMIDSKAIVPMQHFIDESHYNTSQIEPNIAGYYSVNGTLYSMPFNSSQPVLYYNMNMLKAAGIKTPPKTYDQVIADAKKLTKKDNSGKVSVYGIGIADYGWFFEQALATQNALYSNEQNGRNGHQVTAATFDNPAANKFLTFWQTLYNDGVDLNLGTNTSLTQNAFIAGQTAMFIDSSAAYGDVKQGVGNKFGIGISSFPKPAGATGGPIIGGGSMWIPKNQSTQDQEAAWKFIQFIASPKEQAIWSQDTGYFPITKAAYNVPSMKAYLKARPQFQNAINQMHSVKLNHSTQGGLVGVFEQSRQDIQNMIASILLKKETISQGLAATQKQVTQEIQQYNETVGN